MKMIFFRTEGKQGILKCWKEYLVRTINDKFHIQCPLWVLLWTNEKYLL